MAHQHDLRPSRKPRAGRTSGRRPRKARRTAAPPDVHGPHELVAMAAPDTIAEERGAGRRIVDGAVGAVMELQDVVTSGLAGALGLGRQVLDVAGELAAPLRVPFDTLGVTNLVRTPVEAFTNTAAGIFKELEEIRHRDETGDSLFRIATRRVFRRKKDEPR